MSRSLVGAHDTTEYQRLLRETRRAAILVRVIAAITLGYAVMHAAQLAPSVFL